MLGLNSWWQRYIPWMDELTRMLKTYHISPQNKKNSLLISKHYGLIQKCREQFSLQNVWGKCPWNSCLPTHCFIYLYDWKDPGEAFLSSRDSKWYILKEYNALIDLAYVRPNCMWKCIFFKKKTVESRYMYSNLQCTNHIWNIWISICESLSTALFAPFALPFEILLS